MVFRYPGGKTKLLKKFEEHLVLKENQDYYEPFVGGGSVLIHVAKKYPKASLVANDLDKNIYSFWKLFELDDDSLFNSLLELVKTKPTLQLFNVLRSKKPQTIVERAYYALFFNRTTFSGIYSSGPIGGYEQKSKWKIDCRYNPDNLIKKIITMRSLLKGRLRVYNLDFSVFLSLSSNDDFVYLDPPYYVKGKSLYSQFMLPEKHKLLSLKLKTLKNWVLSYDNCKEIREMYVDFASVIDIEANYSINGAKKEWNKTTECIIVPVKR